MKLPKTNTDYKVNVIGNEYKYMFIRMNNGNRTYSLWGRTEDGKEEIVRSNLMLCEARFDIKMYCSIY